MTYDASFYTAIRDGCLSSAQAVVPLLVDLCDPATVVDVGCGEGLWLSVFAEHGCEVTGFDGDYVDRNRLAIPQESFVPIDLAGDWGVQPAFNLALCLEVAEHLPEHCAGDFIRQLCWLAPIIVFSAAIPGQGGAGHVNEQWPHYWAEHFQRHGYRFSGALRWEFWGDDRVENWYRQNMLLCVRDDLNLAARPRLRQLLEGPTSPIWAMVHPVLWDYTRARLAVLEGR